MSRTPGRLSPLAQQFLRRHARQHDYSTAKLHPQVVAAAGATNELAVRDFLWQLKHQAIEAGVALDPDDWTDAQTVIADLRADSEGALSQYRDFFPSD
jgi:urease accessory protein UreF